jgi:hypothetical protein
MKKQLTLLLLLTVVGIALFAIAEGTPGEKAAVAPDVQQMRNEITELRSRLQTLEGRMKSLESTVQELRHPPLLTPLGSQGSPLWVQPPRILLPQPKSESPKIWGEREINGWKFYVIPCEERNVAAN